MRNKRISKYLINERRTLKEALSQLETSVEKTLLVIDSKKKFLGTLTDGDIRRYLATHNDPLTSVPVIELMNHDAVFLTEEKRPNFENKSLIPLLDKNGCVKKIYRKWSDCFEIGDKIVGADAKPFFIAEIGNNHNGNIDWAKLLIEHAKSAGADAVKFQMRNMKALYSSKYLNGGSGDLAVEYTLDVLRKFELSESEQYDLYEFCKEIDIQFLCTPWDIPSALFLDEKFNLPAYKVASADLTNLPLLRTLSQFDKPLILSTGMSKITDISNVARKLEDWGVDFAFLHCNSTYPAPFEDINLRFMKELLNYTNIIGYSGHERGIAVSLAAASMGASIIERHVTLDRTLEGPDHAASLEPQDLASLIRGINEIRLALGEYGDRKTSQGEKINKENLSKSIVAAKDIPHGKIIRECDLAVKSPGIGLSPLHWDDLIGRAASREMKFDDIFSKSDIDKVVSSFETSFDFKLRWGIPVRFHDFNDIFVESDAKVAEFHLSYKDLEVKLEDFLEVQNDEYAIVHAPELFADGFLLNLASVDPETVDISLQHLDKTMQVAERILDFFPNQEKIYLIVNVGGGSLDAPILKTDRANLYNWVIKNLGYLDERKVEIIPQTMPPFPWHFGGQRFHNIFVESEEIDGFCTDTGRKICLDTSHSYLAAKHLGIDFLDFIRPMMPHTVHLHIADARGANGEGLQIGDGDIDFCKLMSVINQMPDETTFIPEIWQGHTDRGAGFWLALQRLESAQNE